MVKRSRPSARLGPILEGNDNALGGGGLFAENHLVTVASFKKVTSITSSGPHLVRNIS